MRLLLIGLVPLLLPLLLESVREFVRDGIRATFSGLRSLFRKEHKDGVDR